MKTTRRMAMGSVAAAGLSFGQGGRRVPVGVSTNDFRDHTNASLAAELKSAGVKRVQLFFTQKDSLYWRYGQYNEMAGMTRERAGEIAGVYRSAGIAIEALGVYATLVHGEEAERKKHLAYFEKMMTIGGWMGVRTFLSEMGHWHPAGEAGAVAYDWRDEVWQRAVETGKELGRMAEGHGATVLLEPIYRSVLASAKRTRVYLEEVGSKGVRAQLDPANLLEVNDLEEMFGQLKGWIGGMHAKDRKLHVTAGVAAGQGDLDYGKFVRLAAREAPGVTLTVEYAGTATYRQALGHLRAALKGAGLAEA